MLLSDHIGVRGTTLRGNKEYVRLMKGYFSDGMAVHCTIDIPSPHVKESGVGNTTKQIPAVLGVLERM